MLQFDISETAETEFLEIIRWYGREKAEKIERADKSIREDLPAFPDIVPLEADGRTRVLHRAEVLWIYEVLPDRVLLLNVLDPRQNLQR